MRDEIKVLELKNFNGGLVSAVDGWLLNPTELQECRDFAFYGQGLTSRPQMVAVRMPIMSGFVDEGTVMGMVYTPHSKKLIMNITTYDISTGRWDSRCYRLKLHKLTGEAPVGNYFQQPYAEFDGQLPPFKHYWLPVNSLFYKNQLYLTNGLEMVSITKEGEDTGQQLHTAVSCFGQYMAEMGRQMYFANTQWADNHILITSIDKYPSHINNFRGALGQSTEVLNEIFLGDEKPITALFSALGNLYASKEDCIYQLSLGNENVPAVFKVVEGIGIVDQRTVAIAYNSIIFLANDGVYLWSGTQELPRKISRNIDNLIDNLYKNRPGKRFRLKYEKNSFKPGEWDHFGGAIWNNTENCYELKTASGGEGVIQRRWGIPKSNLVSDFKKVQNITVKFDTNQISSEKECIQVFAVWTEDNSPPTSNDIWDDGINQVFKPIHRPYITLDNIPQPPASNNEQYLHIKLKLFNSDVNTYYTLRPAGDFLIKNFQVFPDDGIYYNKVNEEESDGDNTRISYLAGEIRFVIRFGNKSAYSDVILSTNIEQNNFTTISYTWKENPITRAKFRASDFDDFKFGVKSIVDNASDGEVLFYSSGLGLPEKHEIQSITVSMVAKRTLSGNTAFLVITQLYVRVNYTDLTPKITRVYGVCINGSEVETVSDEGMPNVKRPLHACLPNAFFYKNVYYLSACENPNINNYWCNKLYAFTITADEFGQRFTWGEHTNPLITCAEKIEDQYVLGLGKKYSDEFFHSYLGTILPVSYSPNYLGLFQIAKPNQIMKTGFLDMGLPDNDKIFKRIAISFIDRDYGLIRLKWYVDTPTGEVAEGYTDVLCLGTGTTKSRIIDLISPVYDSQLGANKYPANYGKRIALSVEKQWGWTEFDLLDFRIYFYPLGIVPTQRQEPMQ